MCAAYVHFLLSGASKNPLVILPVDPFQLQKWGSGFRDTSRRFGGNEKWNPQKPSPELVSELTSNPPIWVPLFRNPQVHSLKLSAEQRQAKDYPCNMYQDLTHEACEYILHTWDGWDQTTQRSSLSCSLQSSAAQRPWVKKGHPFWVA